ncbi:MAG: hypothetical protein ACRDTA_03335 [Pseudonocardiaceae bacterium]
MSYGSWLGVDSACDGELLRRFRDWFEIRRAGPVLSFYRRCGSISGPLATLTRKSSSPGFRT